MINWEELEQVLDAAPQANSLAGPPLGPSIATTAQDMPEDWLQAPRSDAKPEPVGRSAANRISALEHWGRNLERFPPGHIGHEYAKAALERLSRFDRMEESEA